VMSAAFPFSPASTGRHPLALQTSHPKKCGSIEFSVKIFTIGPSKKATGKKSQKVTSLKVAVRGDGASAIGAWGVDLVPRVAVFAVWTVVMTHRSPLNSDMSSLFVSEIEDSV
jgi:hypothetical protein